MKKHLKIVKWHWRNKCCLKKSEHCNPKTAESKDLHAERAQEPPMNLENALGKRLNIMDAGNTAISRVQQLAEPRERQNIE